MAYLNRNRAETLMLESNLDALILLSPESFNYATGAPAGVATMWRTAGAVAVLLPASASEPECAVVSDLFAEQFRHSSHISDVRESPIWVETTTLESLDSSTSASELIGNAWKKAGREQGFNRPATFDPMICYQHLRDALSSAGLSQGRIGFEGSALSMADFSQFQSALPEAELVDASDVIGRLKMVKSASEIDNLRHAVQLAEQGIRGVQEAIAVGVTRNELATSWQQAITEHQQDNALTGSWEYISVGPDPWGGNKAVEPGDLIKVDVGCLVDGYTSDSGRTFVMGQATSLQTSLFDALQAGFSAGSELLRPGVALSDVHNTTLRAIRAAGFKGYTRGHFGHGLGRSVGSEQWPFISADAQVIFEPGMVLAFECPWYINGLGGMIVENQLLITQDGHEMMNSLPLGLTEIPM
jgi:Xaa-Pro dipeptidase